MKLTAHFFQQEDVVFLAQRLLGKFLFTEIDGVKTGGMIVETESYKGPEDRACHAYNFRRTERTKPMFEEGGISYVYLCYGMHTLFNIVTGKKDMPHAILIRAIQPVEGIPAMLRRRKKKSRDYTLTSGPGSLTKALGITISHTGLPLKDMIWVEDQNVIIPQKSILASKRVGVAYAGEDALLPWRFRIKNCPWASPAK